ncbi:MAG: PAS domain S-box protein, partial [Acetobacteraceae bacterium]|nr:PAS domain S-box protein [Acetobacteraceae bacterium]
LKGKRPAHFRVFRNGVEVRAERLPLQRAARGEAVRGEELEIRFNDGSSIVILAQALPIRDREGGVAGAICAATDITERKRAEERLRVLNETLETQVEERTRERDRLWELSEDLLVLADYEGHLLRVSPSWTRLLGHDEAFLLGVDYKSLLHPDDLGTVVALLGETRASGRPAHFEDRVLAADGSWRWIAWVLSPDPSGQYLHGVGRDVTGAKEREAALRGAEEALRQSQKMDAIGQLTGGIAHDFNNILAGVSGSLELLQMRLSQGRVADLGRYATAAMTSVKRASALTHRLLAFARRQALDPRPTSVNKLVASMEELIRRTVGPAIQVETVLAGGLWPTLCDANQLESALLNLCINARDAMPDGGRLTIETANAHLDETYVATQRDVRAGQYMSLSVTDTGVGMPPAVVARAFEPFFTTKPIGQGTGLGLSMLYGFVKQSEGHVRIYSELGQGTTVRLYLPRHQGDPDLEGGTVGRAELPRLETGETVLVVEDEAVVRSLVLEVLEELGYGALEAADGPSGLRILQSKARVDLLVTDVGLPGMNGRQLADAARQTRPDLKVLFITGYAHNAIIANGVLESGMEILAKPFALEGLAAKIQAIIKR